MKVTVFQQITVDINNIVSRHNVKDAFSSASLRLSLVTSTRIRFAPVKFTLHHVRKSYE